MASGSGSRERSSSVSSSQDEEEELSSVYDFVEVCAPKPPDPGRIGEASSSRPRERTSSRAGRSLDDNEDARFEVENTEAGVVVRTDEDVRREWLSFREKRKDDEAGKSEQ